MVYFPVSDIPVGRTRAPQQNGPSFDNLVCAAKQGRRDRKPSAFAVFKLMTSSKLKPFLNSIRPTVEAAIEGNPR
jgi:hypothetical protein